MSEIGKFKLADAMPPEPSKPGSGRKRGKPAPDRKTAAAQAQEVRESGEATDAEGSIRDHMVDIGRGNQQAGRQGQ